jgi:hypothetical protein
MPFVIESRMSLPMPHIFVTSVAGLLYDKPADETTEPAFYGAG